MVRCGPHGCTNEADKNPSTITLGPIIIIIIIIIITTTMIIIIITMIIIKSN